MIDYLRLLLLGALSPALHYPAPAPPPPREITVSITSSYPGGQVRLAIFADATAFAADRVLAGYVAPLTGRRAELRVALPGPGEYVFATFQDLNQNERLDRNLFGVPTEPYGFSQVPGTKWRAPTFAEVATAVTEGDERVTVGLRRWSEY